MITIEKYWQTQNKTDSKNKFDFISVHNNGNGYRLLSPMCIIENIGGERPDWEYDIYPTIKIAEYAARFIAMLEGSKINKKIAVVYCN